jgi:small GTP-binding protein
MQTTQQVKVVLLGRSGVGKSSIVLRFVADSFKGDTDATIGASYLTKILTIADCTVKFNIWDTAGQERYSPLARMYYREADAAILVYDITKTASFEGLRAWVDELTANGPKGIGKGYSVLAVAGNKEDLVDNEEVDTTEAKSWAKQVGAIYHKTSAKTNFGIEQLFREVAVRLNPALDSSHPREGPLAERRLGGVQLSESQQVQHGSGNRKGCC